MEFGFVLPDKLPISECGKLAQAGERLGYDYAWEADQTFFQDPFLVLGLMAESTSYIRLGVGVTNPYTRHPVQIARSLGTLAQVYPDRFSLGIGAGNRKELLTPLGIRQTRPARACREAIEIIRALLEGKSVSYHGDFFSINEVKLEFDLGPCPPLLIAGRGPAILRTAGKVADGVIIGGLISQTGLDFALENIQRGVTKSTGGQEPPYLVSWVTCLLTDEVEQVMDAVRPTIAHIIGGAPSPILEALEIDPNRVERLKVSYETGGAQAAAKHVTEAEVDMFSLIGDKKKVISKLRELETRGINQFAMLLWGATLAEATETLESFSREVVSVFR